MSAFLRFISLPTAVIGITLGCIWLDRKMGWRGVHAPEAGATLVVLGVAIVFWCFVLFLHIGHGSPHPFVAKTKKLVIAGPYCYVRNPMMWGIGTILAGLALWLGSVGLWLGLGMFLIFVSLFVPFYEERDMEKRFGEDYREYCRRVPRWWPRFRA